MNEELQARLLESLDSVTAWAQSSGEFVAGQAPIVYEELVRRGMWGALFLTAAGAILLLASIPFGLFVFRKHRELDAKEESGKYTSDADLCTLIIVPSVFAILSVAIGLPMVLWNGYIATMIHVAPRVYVLEQIAAIVEKMT